jgi:hypothetical protein
MAEIKKEEEVEEYFHFKDYKEWFEALQEAPNPTWIKKRALGSKESRYMPIFLQTALADLFFKEFDVVEEKWGVVVNEIVFTVKIQFLPSYPFSEHRYMTGTGAKPIQQSSGNPASLFPEAKLTNACEYNAPSARTAAISNALTTFANIFGRNLGRDVVDGFSFSKKKEEDKKEEDKKE